MQAQRIVPDGDWDAFMASARTTLPACIRINGSGKFAEAIREELRNNFVAAIAGLSPEEADGETITPPFALPWCAAALLGVAVALRRGIRRSRRCIERPNPFGFARPRRRRYPDALAWQVNYSRAQVRPGIARARRPPCLTVCMSPLCGHSCASCLCLRACTSG